MQKLTVFDFANNEIRVMQDENGEPLFVAKDVANVLGYVETSNMLKRIDEEDKLTFQDGTSGQNREMIAINETGLYEAIFGSSKPEAKFFRKWVTTDVLPSIRKNGMYATDNTIESILDNPDLGIQLLTKLKEERAQKALLVTKITEDKPKVATYNHLIQSVQGELDLKDVAKIIFNNKKGKEKIGRNKFYVILRNDNILNQDNSARQNYVQQGLFNTKLIVLITGKTVPQTFVTEKGIIWLKNKYNPATE